MRIVGVGAVAQNLLVFVEVVSDFENNQESLISARKEKNTLEEKI